MSRFTLLARGAPSAPEIGSILSPMRALAMVHQPDAGPGVFGDAMLSRGIEFDSWMVPEATQPPERPGDYGAVLVFGGAMHADHESEHPWLPPEKDFLRALLAREVPILAVCLGAQLLAEAAGAPPRRAARPEIGWHEVEITAEGADDVVLGPLAPRFEAFQWHSYQFPLPPSATALARSPICLQAYRIGELAWGIQFHAEVTAADAESWIADYRSDADAVAIGLDEEGLLDRTREKIAPWNKLGRALCERFLEVVATRG